MATPIRFYVDFGSPYAWIALRPLAAIAERHGRRVEPVPVILWAVLKAHGITDPMGSEVRRAYMLADMVRSAEFHGTPFRFPDAFRASTHRAARLFHAVTAERPELAGDLATCLFESAFVRGQDVTRPEAIAEIAALTGLDAAGITAAIDGDAGRDGLQKAVEAAIADGVCGSPFMVVDGEGFFGADRLPQIDWRLSGRGG